MLYVHPTKNTVIRNKKHYKFDKKNLKVIGCTFSISIIMEELISRFFDIITAIKKKKLYINNKLFTIINYLSKLNKSVIGFNIRFWAVVKNALWYIY